MFARALLQNRNKVLRTIARCGTIAINNNNNTRNGCLNRTFTTSTATKYATDENSDAKMRWDVIQELKQKSSFSMPEINALWVQFKRRSKNAGDVDSKQEDVSEAYYLSKATFAKSLAPLGIDITPETVDRYFTLFDKNGDGKVSFKELVTGLSLALRGSPAELVEFHFNLWDENGDGSLSLQEFTALLQYTNKDKSQTDATIAQMAEEIFVKLDTDGSGGLSLQEFKVGLLIFKDFQPQMYSSPVASLKQLDNAERDVASLLGATFKLKQGEELKHVRNERAIYYLLDGELTVSLDDIELGTISNNDEIPFIGEVAMFSEKNNFYGKCVSKTNSTLMAIKVDDLTPLILHDHKGSCGILRKMGGLMYQRLNEYNSIVREQKGADHSFNTFATELNALWALKYHTIGQNGKVEIMSSKSVGSAADLSVAYSPGVAEPCIAIQKDPAKAYEYTSKSHLVGVVSNGTAVLGLGNIGAQASKPVMEGKAVLFKQFGNLDSFDIELDESDPDKFIDMVVALAPTFGGINIEDVKAPECFRIEREVQRRVDIPIMHDDQHGTAIIAGAGLLNALEIVNKNIEDIRVVVAGCGAAGFTCAKYFKSLGVKSENLLAADINGIVYSGREDLEANPDLYLNELAVETKIRSVQEAVKGADVFFGLSVGGLLKPDMLLSMNRDPLIFAMANPNPEINYHLAKATRKDVILGTGRSDFPNQINNVCAFPYIFRGALDCRATQINEEMKQAATKAIADLAKTPAVGLEKEQTFGREYLIPKPFDPRLLTYVAPAVVEAALKTGVARINLAREEYIASLEFMHRNI